MVSTQLNLSTLFDPYLFLPFTLDNAGANDDPAQSDLNAFSRADNVSGKLAVAWKWDDINSWTGSGQTGDACALFDIDVSGPGRGNADYAVCVRITNPGGDPTQIAQLPEPQSPIIYQCSDKKTDRCTTTFTIQNLGTSFCEVVNSAEAYPGLGDDGSDILAACSIDLSAFGNAGGTNLLNVCSYPSGSPNSNPFDCVVTAGSGFLQIKKKTTPDQSGDPFSFTLSPAAVGGATSFPITDDANTAGDDVSALIPIDPGTTYSLSEDANAWQLTTASCTGGTANGSFSNRTISGIKTSVGQTVVCTFENVQSGSITIVKDATPDHEQDFDYTTSGTGVSNFSLDDDDDGTNSNTKSFTSLTAGSRTITESDVTGWKVTNIVCSGATSSTVTIGTTGTYDDGDKAVTIDLAAGEDITCTFSNTQEGSITIVKDAVPNDAQDFSFTSTELGNFTLDDDQNATSSNTQAFTNLQPGSHTITETTVAGWTITNITCTGPTGSTVTIGSDSDFDAGDNAVTIDLAAGESVGCTFENTKHGSITIVKDATPDHEQDFDYTTTGAGISGFSLDDDADNTLQSSTLFSDLLPGTRTVAETAVNGWALTNITCSGAASSSIGNDNDFDAGDNSVTINLAAGENVTCTFSNTQGGSITIVKDALPDDAQNFSYSATGTGVSAFDLDDDANNTLANSKSFSGLQPGSRTITEGAVTDWTVTNITCSGYTSSTVSIGADSDFDTNDHAVTIDLAAGENVTCTFENTKAPTVTVDKSANPTSIPETGGSVTYTVVVTNTSLLPVTLTTLSDDKFGDLDGAGSGSTKCDVPQSLAAQGTYTCSFSKTLSAANAGDTHTNVVTATVSNAGGTDSDTDDATVTYANVRPDISVTKVANPTSLSTVASGTLTFPNPDRTFTSDPSSPPAGTPAFNTPTCDDGGANDINSAQVDINCFNRADNISGILNLKWTWDDINAWSGSGATGDGCALLDTDDDGNANLAICARITNSSGSITQVPSAGAADVYVCNDTKTDRCAKPVTPQLGTNKGSTTCTIAIVADGFPGAGDDGSDTEATCAIDKSMPALVSVSNIDLINVCTFPSGEPNSNPFDCVVEVGAGFIQIVKATNVTTAQLFGFTLAGASTDGTSRYAVQGGVSTALIPVSPGTGNTVYSLTETLPTNWTLTNVTCILNGQAVGTPSVANKQITGIEVETGQTTVCTFTNAGVISGNVTYTIEVTNNGAEAAYLFSLTDNQFGDLNGVGTCATGTSTTLTADGGTYSCTFTKTLTGAPGTSHTNTVTAVAKDDEGTTNATPATASATVNFTAPSPP